MWDSGQYNDKNKKKLQFLIDKCNLSEGSQSTGTSGSSDNEDIEIGDDAKLNKGDINSFISRVFGESASKLSLMLKSFSGSVRKNRIYNKTHGDNYEKNQFSVLMRTLKNL